MFPLGEIEKPEVRRLAEAADLATAKKKTVRVFVLLENVILKNFKRIFTSSTR